MLLAAGIGMQFALVSYLEWLSGIGWSGKARPARDGASSVGTDLGVPAMATSR
jgi:hypothetical protein